MQHEKNSPIKMGARSKWSNLSNFDGLETLCPMNVFSCKFLYGLLHLRTAALENMNPKRGLQGRQIATFGNMGGNMITYGC